MKKKTKKISVKLPSKLHAMLSKALDDVERLELSKKYKINMDVAMQRKSAGAVCELCLGGSQLVSKLPKGRFEWWFDEKNLTRTVAKKLIALDHLRQGDVKEALVAIGKSPDLDECRDVVDYHENPKIWKAQMRLLAAELEDANL